MLVCMMPLPSSAETAYVVTANLYVPGELNTQLPGVTAYVTNPSNPLGLGGYEAKAPTTPVSNNATLTVKDDGSAVLFVSIPNPVFTIQKISGCSNAEILSTPKDSETYSTQDGSASRTGRVKSISLKLKDLSGEYVFSDCVEFPTLLGVDWTVPLTLSVDFTGVDLSKINLGETETVPANEEPEKKDVNFDKLNAIIKTVAETIASAVVSEDGSDVETEKTWTTKTELDALKTELAKAKAALAAADQATADSANESLREALKVYQSAQKSGKMEAASEGLGKTLAPGTYTVSANIWFNKADTGLPLNPHLTNSTFPPYNPVPDNATLTVKKDGTAEVVIPIVIPNKVMTLRTLRGADIIDEKKDETGAITELTINLGQLTGDSTVQSALWEADIEMGDLAMSISGLDKPHTWPAQFEINLSGVATTDGGVMPTVELKLIDNIAATAAMASVGAASEPESDTASESEEGEAGGVNAAAVIIAILFAAAIAAVIIIGKKKAGEKK